MWTRTWILFFLAPVFVLSFSGGAVMADVISGTVELHRQKSDSTATDATGLSTGAGTIIYLQRYNLSFYNMIYPYVNLRAGMRVEKIDMDSEGDAGRTSLDSTVLMPSVGLTLRNPFVFAGVSYDERDQRQEASGIATTLVRETQNAFLGFKPVGLPTLDLQAVKQDTFDRERLSRDTEQKTFSISSGYRPVKTVLLNYRSLYTDFEDRLTPRETKSETESARASYQDTFLDGRVVVSTSYNMVRQEVRSSSGSALIQFFPYAGLSAINDMPETGALDANPALIDANLTSSSGMNIGALPSLQGDTRKRNIGIDFGEAQEVSTLFVWVDRQLPDSVVGSFFWDIYISGDNQTWTVYQSALTGVFEPFENKFVISFPPVKTRYIKVVTRPLAVAVVVPPGVDVNTILITEVQSFVATAVSAEPGQITKLVTRSEYGDLNGRLYFLRNEAYSLLYDMYYQNRYARRSEQTSRNDILINTVIGYRKFTRVFSGNAKVMHERDNNENGTTNRFVTYEGSLLASASSLPKLHHNAVMTVKKENSESGSDLETDKDTVSFYVTNDAEIYPGINALVTGGRSVVSTTTSTSDTAVTRTDNKMLTVGATIVPHRSLLFSANHNWAESEQEGPPTGSAGAGRSDVTSRTTSMNASFSPITNLYFFGAITKYAQTGQPPRTSRTLSGSWTFQQTGGALELRFVYSEDVQTDTSTRNRVVGPYARWRINRRMLLDGSYMTAKSDSPSAKNESRSFNTSFKLQF